MKSRDMERAELQTTLDVTNIMKEDSQESGTGVTEEDTNVDVISSLATPPSTTTVQEVTMLQSKIPYPLEDCSGERTHRGRGRGRGGGRHSN